MDFINELILTGGDVLWTWLVLPILALLGVYFTVRSGVVQFRLIPEMFRTLTDKTPLNDAGEPQSVSAFQAFTISAASRVGVGTIAGVGTAIAAGAEAVARTRHPTGGFSPERCLFAALCIPVRGHAPKRCRRPRARLAAA